MPGTAPTPGGAMRTGARGWICAALVAASAVVAASPAAAAAGVETTTAAQSCGYREPGDTRPRIGLALGGGGARGIAHLGVLRKIEQLHIPIDCVAGTSMGALVGGMYASGATIDELERLVLDTDWPRMFDDSLDRPDRSFRRKQDDRSNLATVGVGFNGEGVRIAPGLLQGERVLALFEKSTLHVSAVDDFDLLPIPFRAVATDLNTGDAVVLDHGSLAMAMRASMSLPGIFQPAEIDGRVLLDGGLVNQVPVDVVRAMGADIVIAIDVGTPLVALGSDASLLQVVSQITGMMTTGNTRRQMAELRERDVLVVPVLGDAVATGDFEKAQEALAIGIAAGEAAAPRLAALAIAADAYDDALARRPAPSRDPPIVEFVRFENLTDYADEVLLEHLQIEVGKPLDTDAVEDGLLRAYSLNTLAIVTYEIVHEDGRTGVLLRARPKSYGPNYLQLGMIVNSDFEGQFEGNLRAAVLFSPLSRYGAEARVAATIGTEPGLSAEYFHPLDAANRNLLYAKAEYENPNIHVFDADGHDIATYDVRVAGIELKAAREFGNFGALAVGVERATGKADVEIGSPLLPDLDFEVGQLYTRLTLDRLDNISYPREGYLLETAYTVSRDWLGADDEFAKFDLDGIYAHAFGPHSLQVGVRYHATVSGVLPVQDRYRLGGRTRLAGFRLNELTGQHYGVLLGGYNYKLAELFGQAAVVGGTIEYGNAWELREDMSLADGIWNASMYVGIDSWIGPMTFGFGWREGGHGQLMVGIGHQF